MNLLRTWEKSYTGTVQRGLPGGAECPEIDSRIDHAQVISDINLPEIDGVELSRLLQAARPSLPAFLGVAPRIMRHDTFSMSSGFQVWSKKGFFGP
jgi:CheY-like chemotaxis protein